MTNPTTKEDIAIQESAKKLREEMQSFIAPFFRRLVEILTLQGHISDDQIITEEVKAVARNDEEEGNPLR
jgi:hypothetical protein